MKAGRQTRKTARRLFRDCFVDTRIDEKRVRQVVLGIIESKRRHAFAILSHLQHLVRLNRDRHTAVVESATELPDDVMATVKAHLARTYGPGLETSFSQNPELIGGMRVKVGSDVYDGSVRGRLAALEARL